MFNRRLPPVLLSLLLAIGLPAEQDVGTPRAGSQTTPTIFDEIADARAKSVPRGVGRVGNEISRSVSFSGTRARFY
jgi:hypothetical protein